MKTNYYIQSFFPLCSILHRMPNATAKMTGSTDYPGISGIVKFYQTEYGVILYTEIKGLPNNGQPQIFGYHIHEGISCTGNAEDPFADALTHYNPNEQPHPEHGGDLPPLFGNNGIALSVFLTNRFLIRDILGKTIIIHAKADDFVTQPSGNAGEKIACGVINKT